MLGRGLARVLDNEGDCLRYGFGRDGLRVFVELAGLANLEEKVEEGAIGEGLQREDKKPSDEVAMLLEEVGGAVEEENELDLGLDLILRGAPQVVKFINSCSVGGAEWKGGRATKRRLM